MTIQILLPLAKQVHWQELRYALRSWEAHYGIDLEIFTVGQAQPDFLKGKHPHLQARPSHMNRWKSIAEALVKASSDPRLADEFILMNDDFFVLSSIPHGVVFYEGTLREKIESLGVKRYDSYRDSLVATQQVLARETGRKSFRNFETHTPMPMTRAGLVEAARLASASLKPLQVRSLVGNLATPKSRQVGMSSDVKIRESGEPITRWDQPLISSQDDLFVRLRPLLEERFPQESVAERFSVTRRTWGELGGLTAQVELPREWFARPGMKPYNPSLAWRGEKLLMSVRYSFFWYPGLKLTAEQESEVLLKKKSAGKYGVSETFLCELDPVTLAVRKWRQLEPHGFPEDHANHSLEDLRLFRDGAGLYGIGVYLHQGQEHHSQALVKLTEKRVTHVATLEKPFGRTEKNWSPVEGSPETFVYSPTQLWAGSVSGEPYKGTLHGGTQLVKLSGRAGYASIVHNFVGRKAPGAVRPERHYVHYLARWDESLRLVELSDGFTFGSGEPVEFASGLVRDERTNELIAGWGVGDSRLALGRISEESFLRALKPYEPKSESQVVR